jgi:tetratricopeptide (TPR) repeat protein
MAINKRLALVGLWFGVWLIVAFVGTRARAELNVVDLTGTAVSGVGPFYQDVNDAIRAFAQHDYETALTHLQSAKKVTRALAPAEVMMARLYFDAGVARGGNAMLETAIKTSPEDPEAYLLFAERALAEGRLAEAEMMFLKIEKLVDTFNQNPRRRQDMRLRAYSVGATVDQVRGNLSAAKAKLESLIRLDAKNASSHEQLGRLLFAQNDQRAAYEEFKLAAELDQKALPADLMMATLYGDKVTAQKWLDRAIQQNPDDLRTLVSAANYLLKTNQVKQSSVHAEKAIALDPDGFESNLMAGQLARMEADSEKAVKHLSTAHLLQPINFDVMHQLSLALSELPDEASRLRGLQFAELTARQNPDNSDYLAALGWTHYRLNRKATAERILGAALSAKKGQSGFNLTSDLGYYLANLYNDRGNAEEAIKVLRSSLDTDQPFAYRKAAERLLAQLTKSAGDASDTEAGSPQTGQ